MDRWYDEIDDDDFGHEVSENSSELELASDYVPYELESPLTQYPRYKRGVHLSVPKDNRHWGRSNINYGQCYLGKPEYMARNPRAVELFEKNLKKDNREASLEDQGNKLSIKCGIRRNKMGLSAQQIAEGTSLYSRHDNAEHLWSARCYTKDFYSYLVHPYVKSNSPSTVFDWAYERVQIANGFTVAMGLVGDFPPYASEHPYTKIAGRMFNTTPESLEAEREIEMDETKRALYEQAKISLDDKITPETVLLILENSDIFTVELLRSESLKKALRCVPAWLENGLIVDRASEFIKMNRARGMSSRDAAELALRMIRNIYSRRERPWWFRENIDFTKVVDWESEAEVAPLVSKCAGYGFEYAMELYRAGGRQILGIEGLNKQQAVFFMSKVAEDYGIGNTPRAMNVVKFAMDMLATVAAADRAKTLSEFGKYLHKKKPLTEIVGKLEGADASFVMPGVYALVTGQLGNKRAEQDKLDDVTLTVQHLLDLAGPLARPLQERAKTKPQTKYKHDRQNLLAASIETKQQITAQEAETTQAVNPLLGIFEFYKQVEAECKYIDEDLVQLYFMFYAPKMPNPFAPPKGFLTFLRKYNEQRHPHWKFAGVERSGRARGITNERNDRLMFERYLVVANLIDAWVVGIMDETHLYEVLDSLVNPSTSHETEEAEKPEDEDDDYRLDPKKKKLDAQYFEVKELIDNLTAQAQLFGMGILTADEIKELARDPEFKNLIPKGRTVDELTQAIHLMMSGEMLTIRNIRYVFEKGNVLERGHGMDSSTAGRVRALWETADAFFKCHEEVIEIERELREELSRDVKFDHGDRPAELGEVISKCVDSYYAKLCCKCEQIFAGSKYRFRPDIDKLATYLLPLKPFTDILVNFYWKVAHSVSKANKVLDDLLKKAPSAPVLEGPGIVTTNSAALEAQFVHSLSLGFYLKPIEQQIRIDGAADQRAGKIGMAKEVSSITNAVSAMVAFVMALEESGFESTKLITDNSPIDISEGGDLSKTIDDFKARIQVLQEKIRENTPKVREEIIEKRKNGIGLVTVGGKIHVLHPVDPSRFEMFKQATGFTSTQFALIHANTSMLLPPTPTAEELTALISALVKVGILDSEFPELQVTLPGRLPPEDVAVLGSFVLLATELGMEFPEKAFSTNQDYATGARIMAYDAGNRPIKLPFMTKLEGRTDMLCRRHAGDINLMQKVGSVLLQAHAKKGPFAKLATEFKKNYREILKKHGIEDVLDGKWIFTDDEVHNDNEANHDHYLLVKKCTDAYFASAESGEGIIFEVRKLFELLETQIREEQAKLIESGEACDEINILLS